MFLVASGCAAQRAQQTSAMLKYCGTAQVKLLCKRVYASGTPPTDAGPMLLGRFALSLF
jgi:hypothetical protein